MKQRIFTRLLCLVLVLVCALPALAWAEDTSRSYDFDLSVGGQQEVRAAAGETVTVTLVLKRTDKAESAEMYGMQTEILYDDSFFKLVEGSIMTAPGVRWSDMGRRTGGRAFYLNFVSFSGGEPWASEVTVGSFQMEVIGTKGVSSLTPENSIVSVQSGTDHYTMTDNPVTVIVTTDCTVTFESAGGSEVPAQSVQYGEKVKRPADPVREGYHLTGWYTDLDHTREWDFKNDVVKGNMTLYAGWAEGAAPTGGGSPTLWICLAAAAVVLAVLVLLLTGKRRGTFQTNGGTALETVYVKRGGVVGQVLTPVKPGAMFDGWFSDAACTKPWDVEHDEVRGSMTLYARWR